MNAEFVKAAKFLFLAGLVLGMMVFGASPGSASVNDEMDFKAAVRVALQGYVSLSFPKKNAAGSGCEVTTRSEPAQNRTHIYLSWWTSQIAFSCDGVRGNEVATFRCMERSTSWREKKDIACELLEVEQVQKKK